MNSENINWDEIVGQPDEESIRYICLRCMDTFELAYDLMVRCPNCLGPREHSTDIRNGPGLSIFGRPLWVRRYADLEKETQPKKVDS